MTLVCAISMTMYLTLEEYKQGNDHKSLKKLFNMDDDLDSPFMVIGLTGVQLMHLSIFILFVMFEIIVGIYFPCMGQIKSDLPIGEVRNTMVNLFYVPMNLILTFVKIGGAYLFNEKIGWIAKIPDHWVNMITYTIVCVMLFGSSACLFIAVNANKKDQDKTSKAEDADFTDIDTEDEAEHTGVNAHNQPVKQQSVALVG